MTNLEIVVKQYLYYNYSLIYYNDKEIFFQIVLSSNVK